MSQQPAQLALIDRLERSEARFRTMIEKNVDGIVILDMSGVVRFVNPAAELLIGRPAAELLDTLLGFPLVAGEATEIDLVRHDGTLHAAEMRVAAIDWEGEAAFLASLRDITERRRAERLEKDRNRVLELVARNQPLDATLDRLAQMIAGQYPELHCSLLLRCEDKLYHAAAGNLPSDLVRSSELVAEHLGSESFAPLDLHAGTSPAWRHLQARAKTHGLIVCWVAPIYASDGAIFGLIVVYDTFHRPPAPAHLRLVEAVGHLAAIAAEHLQLTQRLAHQAQHDALTGLPNRLLFNDRLQRAVVTARRNATMVGLLYLDLDRFKVVNDTLGHPVGDALLVAVSERLISCVRQNDTLARMGGDEFTFVLSDIKSPQGAVKVAKKLLAACEQPFMAAGHELHITASIGASIYPDDGESVDELLRKADHALYRSKQQGRNMYQLYSTEMNNAIAERMGLEMHLRGALARGELMLCYQPQLDALSQQFAGVEALMRWHHPELGVIVPGRFIPIAEENGLIVPIGTWALHEACRQGRRSPLQVAVNVSALQFSRPEFVETVAEALTLTMLPPRCLELELTESTLMHNTRDTQGKLNDLRSLGVSIAIDDFGIGYSSLSYLQRLPITTLKIDRSFVHDIGADMSVGHGNAAIVQAITTLAHSLGMTVVAEGVETREQLDFLLHVGCDRVQGFLLGRPMPPEELEIALSVPIRELR
jgi:diguanylate cyclase (GGDEF)-like protein